MKILVASHSYIVDLNCEKLRALAHLKPGIEVTVVVPKTWKPGGVQNKIITTQYRNEGNFKIVPISNFSQNHQGLLTFGIDLISLLREFRPQIIQVEQGSKALAYTQMIVLNQLLKLKAKNIFFTWWNLPYELKFPVTFLEKYNLNHSDGIITGNQDGAKVIRQRGYQGPIQVMPQLGINQSLFTPQTQPELASQLGITSEDFVVGFVGRFVPEKGLLTLLQALLAIPNKPWKLLLLGRGYLQAELIKISTENNLKDRVIITESVPHNQVANYINLMNTLILPSETTYKFKTLTTVGWKEQFGHVLIEAMACKVPVIGSDSGEIPHVIGDAGLVFPEGNIAALANCLVQLIEKPDMAKSIGQKGHQKAMHKYTNQALAQQQFAFYQELVNS
ncbi:hormogonium polysaccharide biosynthesis glycosyltransferase HpsO [Umezakia ovalisporum]|jgi:glycosyltransferase involved in cell wall biosynthesis|uniref:Hormogonium polysaccharide biosynthesis glycosyltransferase HpsO n=1 Tax=Umezakia ovalisporum FSS-62 TaxID=2971776 RepID=A0AA43KDQ1_9CYAN|nr:hormogonium polysaccharide biosynthesis glycosyltransferase HpsO [Umezakia ovalisporum]MBI1241339.1 glycosyltransferase [Nostoc sp. RI_552]MDH6062592.1 hormogonium polysaccharide biosynthesis glycosyltransferase HpsO [Umezakia ovalisporum FSS-62]MDH6084086.1 hormogonium polysaccharide biosynthesis glycosyltransferase HpsO [Umezakia ovalisporum TAC611]MDH6090085.1 hormogonium polysaccharide biosynthesis glycosyltransferase HpsO [Umezakia ovalisporum Ak1311]CEJ43203.1 Glycosyl transferase, gr